MFSIINKKSVKTETKEHIQLHLFYCKKKHFILKLSQLLIMLSDIKTELTLVTSEYNCTESVQILRCHLLYLTIYLIWSDHGFQSQRLDGRDRWGKCYEQGFMWFKITHPIFIRIRKYFSFLHNNIKSFTRSVNG